MSVPEPSERNRPGPSRFVGSGLGWFFVLTAVSLALAGLMSAGLSLADVWYWLVA